MNNYFDEKSHQVDPGSFTSFGISIQSRYSKANEIVEMINFTKELAMENVNHYVNSIFYDSKADLCTFEINPSIKSGDPVALKIEEAARNSIAQYELFGLIGHGSPMDDFENA